MRPAAINLKSPDISVSGSEKSSPSYLTSRNVAITTFVTGLLGAVATILVWQLGLTSNWVTYTVAGVSGALLIGSAIATMIHHYSKNEAANSRTTKKAQPQLTSASTHTPRPANKPNLGGAGSPSTPGQLRSIASPTDHTTLLSGRAPETPQQTLTVSSALSPTPDEYLGYLQADDVDNVLRLLRARAADPTSVDIHKMIKNGAIKCVKAVLQAFPTIEVEYVKSVQNDSLRTFIEAHNNNVPIAKRHENTQLAKSIILQLVKEKDSFDEILNWMKGSAVRDPIEAREPLDNNSENTVFNLLIKNGLTSHLQGLCKLMGSALEVTAEDITFAEQHALPTEKDAIIALLKAAHQALAANPGSRNGSLKPSTPQIIVHPLNTYSPQAMQALMRIRALATNDASKDELLSILQEHGIYANERIIGDKTILQIAAEAGAIENVKALVLRLDKKILGLAHYIETQPNLSDAIKEELAKVAA